MTTPLIQFTLLILVKGRQREFNFRQRSADWYDGNTTDERGERYYFQLIQQNAHWAFGKTVLPDWLRESEQEIVQAILAKMG